uniref:PH domain-containing protein n=1 Tax=Romanomermis culicivorax TaxID=13658 RepID=A0A915HJH4_ROMCU
MDNEESFNILHEGLLYRHITETFFKKAYWKDCWAVLQSDGLLKIYKDKNDVDDKQKAALELDLKQLVLYLAFGDDARKLNPPKIRDESFHDTPNLIAIPKDKDRQTIHWLFAPTNSDLMLWIKNVAESVSYHTKPPLLGLKRGDEEKIIDLVKKEFALGDNPNEWQVYWLSLIISARKKGNVQSATICQVGSLCKTSENLTEDKEFQNDQKQRHLSTIDCEKKESNFSPSRDNSFVTVHSKMFYHARKMPSGATKSEIVVHIEKRIKKGEKEADTDVHHLPDENQNMDYVNIHLLKNEQNHLKAHLNESSVHGMKTQRSAESINMEMCSLGYDNLPKKNSANKTIHGLRPLYGVYSETKQIKTICAKSKRSKKRGLVENEIGSRPPRIKGVAKAEAIRFVKQKHCYSCTVDEKQPSASRLLLYHCHLSPIVVRFVAASPCEQA